MEALKKVWWIIPSIVIPCASAALTVFVQFQELRRDVQQLTMTVKEQAADAAKAKQDYNDLDKRLLIVQEQLRLTVNTVRQTVQSNEIRQAK